MKDFWKGLKPLTRQLFIFCSSIMITVIVVTLIVTGQFLPFAEMVKGLFGQ